MAVERFKTQVLILHPHQAVLDACRKVFREEDYTLHLAQSGREALAMLGETPIDYFVTAEELPGMTGSETLREARRRSPETEGILIASRGTSENEIAAMASSREFAAVLKSTASPRELFQLVAGAARQRRMGELSESANDADHSVDTSISSVTLPALSDNDQELFVVDDEADITGARAALRSSTAPTAGSPDGEAIAEILVLSRDEAFYHAISQAARGLYPVHRCPALQEAEDIVGEGRVGVLVTDAAVAPTEVQSITARLRQLQPSLVTIVAGRRDDGDQLMGLISEGIVYRFLLKPVSPGRARLALEASAKKSLEYRDNPPPVPELPRTSSTNTLRALRSTVISDSLDDDEDSGFGRWLPIGAALAVGLIAGSVWLLGDGDDAPSATDVAAEVATAPVETGADELQPTPLPPASEPVSAPPAAEPDVAAAADVTDGAGQIRELRRAAFKALAEGRVAEPDGDNALSLYAKALALDPYADGLRDDFNAAVADALRQTESAITRGALNEAAATLARIREVQPYEARLPFLESQLRKERVAALVAQARASSARGDGSGALAILDRAAVIAGPDDPTIAAARDAIAASGDQRELTQLLQLASARVAGGELTEPAKDNAAFYYQAVLARDPENAIARQGLSLIGATLVTDGTRALQRGQLEAADSLADAAAALVGDSSAVTELRSAINTAQTARTNAAVAQPEVGAQQAPAAEEAPASAANEAGTGSAAEPTAESPAPVAASPAAAKPTAATPPPAAELPPLVRSKYVPPSYPRTAARRNQDGWAHLSFTVRADGTVADVGVIDSAPGNTFVAAARRALEQWEFEPTIIDGVAIEREGDVRINFSLAQ